MSVRSYLCMFCVCQMIIFCFNFYYTIVHNRYGT